MRVRARLKIRALTYHIAPRNLGRWDKSEIRGEIEEAKSTLEVLKRVIEEGAGVKVWTTRIALPVPPPETSLTEVAQAILELADGKHLVSIGGLYSGDQRVEQLYEVIQQDLFAHIIVRERGRIGDIAKMLQRWSSRIPESMTKLGVEFSKREVLTPYFPLSRTPPEYTRNTITMAFLYVNDVKKELATKGIHGLEHYLQNLAKRLGSIARECLENGASRAVFGGFDFSLSPWMEESVARLLEEHGDCVLEGGGCISIAYEINSSLARAGMNGYATGFNEIMLPVGEDNLLKEKARSGKLRVRDLLLYVPVCLAGIDMVVFRASEKQLKSLLESLWSYAMVKKRAVGFRGVVLEPDETASELETKSFGSIPVMEL